MALHAKAELRWKDNPNAHSSVWFRIEPGFEEAYAQRIFAYLNSEDELKELMHENNGQEFVITSYEICDL